ncbi:hypothetical protein ACFQ14_08685 [Pseudahrensia aquimaris]|uniref:Uncharacterized protein n=1 Tax=Pseudahrensia aquimaris TaxID=744461 RepID=A0ABW3FI31_9HYPH
MTEKISTRAARQGRSNMNIFYVLVGGLVLSALAFAVLEVAWG